MAKNKKKPPSLVQRAADFAKKAHEGQQRKYTGDPYFVHCEAVALKVKARGGNNVQIAAAYLHDTIEDCGVTEEEIRSEFGPKVAKLVVELTDVFTSEAFPYLNRFLRKRLEAYRLGAISKEAKLIKYCDIDDNTSSIMQHDPDFARVYMREKADMLDQLKYGGLKYE